MKVTGNANIRNRFDIHCRDIRTGEETKYQAHNIVLDAMWTRLVNFQSFFDYIRFGTGTGTLSPARTSLFNDSGGKAATTVESVRALPTSRRMRQIVLQPEEYVGHELTEVGVAYSADSTSLVTHAFIEDSEGNQISIVKTDTMVVTIYATIFFELGELTSMYGGQWRWVMPLKNNELLSYLMGASFPTTSFWVTRAPLFSNSYIAVFKHGSSDTITVANWIKDAANKKVTTPVMRLGINTGNGAIRGFGLSSVFRGLLPISGVFAGHTIEGENIGVGDGETTGFNTAWGMIQNATVYVDGVPVDPADVIIREDYPLDLIDAALSADYAEEYFPSPLERQTNIAPLFGYVAAPALTTSIWQAEYQPGVLEEIFQVYKEVSYQIPSVKFYSRAAGQDEWNLFCEFTSTDEATKPVTVPAGHKFLRIETTCSDTTSRVANFEIRRTAKPIFEFATPPAAGAVITADYTVPYIPKDEFHVLDLQCSIQWGEG